MHGHPRNCTQGRNGYPGIRNSNIAARKQISRRIQLPVRYIDRLIDLSVYQMVLLMYDSHRSTMTNNLHILQSPTR